MEQGKVCLVTGASSGIGLAIAIYLAFDKKYRVIITARREERLMELSSPNIDAIPGDLMSATFQDFLVNYIWDKYGGCDFLFNCAGTLEVGSIEEIDIDKIVAMVRLNVEANFRLTYVFLKKFKQQGFGHIVNITSVLGTKVRPTAGAYAGTKYAVEALSEALRMELAGSNIKISCIEPGLVMTELHNTWHIHPKESMNIRDPLTTDDIVETVKFIINQPDHVNIPKLMILPRDHSI